MIESCTGEQGREGNICSTGTAILNGRVSLCHCDLSEARYNLFCASRIWCKRC